MITVSLDGYFFDDTIDNLLKKLKKIKKAYGGDKEIKINSWPTNLDISIVVEKDDVKRKRNKNK